MATRIKIQVRKIRGPWLNIVKQRVEQDDVMAIITAHRRPRFRVASHTPQPEMFPGVWKLTPYAKETTGGIKLIGIQAELLPQDLEGVDGAVGRWRFKLMVNKSGVGFFEVEGIAIVSDGYIAVTEELMKFFDEHPVMIEVLLVAGEIGQRSDNHLTIASPTVGEA